MLARVGLGAYLVASIFRPADWWKPIQGMPTDYYIFIAIGLFVVISGKLPDVAKALATDQSKLVGLFVGACLLSNVFSGTLYQLADNLAIMAKLFCIYLAFAALIDSIPQFRFLLLVVIFLVSLVAYQGKVLAETGVGWAGQDLYWAHRIRWVGMYDGANVLCMLFVIAIACTIHLVLGPWGKSIKPFGIAAGAIIIYGIYLTNSRGGFLSFILVVGCYYLLRKRETILKIGVGRLVGLGVICIVLLMLGPSRMDSMKDDDHSAAGRIDAWQAGMEMLRGQPVFGVGMGEWTDHHFRMAHNAFVQTMGELGIVGLFFWIAMQYWCGKTLFMIFLDERTRVQERSMAAIILTCLLGFLSTSFFITTTQFDWTYIFMGLTVSLLRLTNHSGMIAGMKDYRRVAVLVGGGVVVIFATIHIFYASG